MQNKENAMKKRAIFLIVGIMCIAVCIGVVVIKTM